MPQRLTLLCAGLLAASVLLPGRTAAQTSLPAAAPAPALASVGKGTPPDLCAGAIDPYNAERERILFWQAAGVDNELNHDRFLADQARANGFVRKFDSWNEMLKYDESGKGTIDWPAADAYRQALRRRVMDRFDWNKDGRLTGKERDAANLALANGDIWADANSADSKRPSSHQAAGSPGKGDASGVADARRPAPPQGPGSQPQAALDANNKSGGGAGGGQGQAAAPRDARRRGNPFEARFNDWCLEQFDADGKGYLNDAEKAEAAQFQKKLQDVGKIVQDRMLRPDANGNVAPEEKARLAEEWRNEMPKAMALSLSYIDSDGDGKITPEKAQAFGEKVAAATMDWLSDFADRFDDERKGRLTADQRRKFLDALRGDAENRVKAYADQDGRLHPDGMVKLAKDYLAEIGIKPYDHPHPASAPAAEKLQNK